MRARLLGVLVFGLLLIGAAASLVYLRLLPEEDKR